MSSSVSAALGLTEILQNIASAIPIYDDDADYQPHLLLGCVLVSKHWHRCFIPFLYSYYVASYSIATTGHAKLELYEEEIKVRRKYSQYIRHYYASGRSLDDCLPFDDASPPTALLSLYLYQPSPKTMQLVNFNQGSQLRQLTLHGPYPVCEIKKEYHKAIMNLPLLETLDLSMWNFDNDLLLGLFKGCSSTLRELTLTSVGGYDRTIFGDVVSGQVLNQGSGGGGTVQLLNLQKLVMLLDWVQSKDCIYLPQICPALESLDITVDMEEYDMTEIAKTLKKYCTKFTSISYTEGYSMSYEYGYFPESYHEYVSLFKDCSVGLESVRMTLPTNLDLLMLDALLTHSHTLKSIKLDFTPSKHPRNRDRNIEEAIPNLENVLKLLTECPNLEYVELTCTEYQRPMEDLGFLNTKPWACSNLKVVLMDNLFYRSNRHYTPSVDSTDSSDMESIDTVSKIVEAKGWFTKSSTMGDSYCWSKSDSAVVHGLLRHISETSNIQNMKYLEFESARFYFDRDL